MVLGVQSDDYLWDPAFRTLAGVRPGTYTLETVLNAAAYVASWCREEFGERGAGGAAGGELEAAAARLSIGAEGLLTLPYWNAAETPTGIRSPAGRSSGGTVATPGPTSIARSSRASDSSSASISSDSRR